MIRKSELIPGHDCIYARCTKTPSCQSEAPGSMDHLKRTSHGIGSDRWLYMVIADDKSCAVSLVVSSGDYPSSIPSSHFSEYDSAAPHASALTHHSRDAFHCGEKHENCNVLESELCYFDTSFTFADVLFQKHGSDQFAQTEEFWRALENCLPTNQLHP